MGVAITINGTDRTSKLVKGTLEFTRVLTNEVDDLFFTIKVTASEYNTIVPNHNDEVVVTNNGTRIFGGYVTKRMREHISKDLYHVSIEVKDYSFDFTRRFITESFDNKTQIYIANSIVNESMNTKQKVIDGFDEGWSAGTHETSKIVSGQKSLLISNTSSNKSITVDLTALSDGSSSPDSDYIQMWFYIDDISNFTSMTLKLGTSTLTSHFVKSFTSSESWINEGWCWFNVLKSDFTKVGSLGWDQVAKVQVECVGSSDVYFDDLRLVQANQFDKYAIERTEKTIISKKFNLDSCSQAFKELAKEIGYFFYVSENKNIHLQPSDYEFAPFVAEVGVGGTIITNSLKYEDDLTDVKNVVYLRGGNYEQSGSVTDEFKGDGERVYFPMRTTINAVTVSVDTGSGFVVQAVGRDFIDTDDGTYDWFVNKDQKYIRQAASATTLSSTDIIKIVYNPDLPVFVKVQDTASIATYGQSEFKIIDRTVEDRDAAKERARAEIDLYKEPYGEGSYMTYKDSLRVGHNQQIIDSAIGFNSYFIVYSITAKIHSNTKLVYSVEFISKQKQTLTETLVNLILRDDKLVAASRTEELDEIKVHDESILIQESHSSNNPSAGGSGTYSTYGPDSNNAEYGNSLSTY